MKTATSKFCISGLIAFITLSIFLISCTKNDGDSEPESAERPKLTELILEGSNGKSWHVTDFSITTYKPSGDVENIEKPNVTVDVEPLMFFADYKGANNLQKIFSTESPVTTYLPLVGGWSLDESNQKLSFTCISDCPSPETKEWIIVNFVDNMYGKVVQLKNVSQVNGKKVEIFLELFDF
jgi:hypothetical protein